MHTQHLGQRIVGLTMVALGLSAVPIALPLNAAEVPTGYQDFRIVGNEDQVWAVLRDIAIGEGRTSFDDNTTGGFLTAMSSVVTLTASADSQVIFYDHWEDGFEAVFPCGGPTLAACASVDTLVLGDGDVSDGRACDYTTDPRVVCGTATEDLIFRGTGLSLNSNQSLPICGAAPCIARVPNPDPGGACSAAVPAAPADRRCSVPLPRNPVHIRFDGGDRLVTSGGPISLVHTQDPLSAYIGGASEVIPRQAVENATSYTIPIGEDLFVAPGTTTESLEFVYLQLVAYDDDTDVTITSPGAGVVSFTLNAGEHYSTLGQIESTSFPTLAITVNAGAKVATSKPISGMILTGSREVFTSRFYLLLPDVLHGTDYITTAPGDEGTQGVRPMNLYIINPDPFNPIVVQSVDTVGSRTFNIPAGEAVNYFDGAPGNRYVPGGSNVRLTSNRQFWGVSTYDSEGAQADWGDSWIATKFLKSDHTISFGPGVNNPVARFAARPVACSDGNPATVCNSENRSPVFVAATQNNTRVHVDLNADGVFDQIDVNSDDIPDPANATPTPAPAGWALGPDATTYIVNELRALRIYDHTDYDNTGTIIVADKPVSVSSGQDTDQGQTSDRSLDFGYTVFQAFIDAVLTLEKVADPVFVPTTGGVVTYTVTLDSGDVGALTVVGATDTLPAGIVCGDFVSGSSLVTYPNFAQDMTDPACAVDGITGLSVLTWTFSPDTLPINQRITISYQMDIPAGPSGVLTNTAEGQGTLGGSVFRPIATADVTRTDAEIEKSVAIGGSGLAQPGTTLTYTLQVFNTGLVAETGVTILDAIPANTTYVPLSATGGGPFTASYLPGSNSVQFVAASVPATSGPHTVSFQVVINPNAPVGEVILNQANYGSVETPYLVSNEVETPISAPGIEVVKSGPAGPLHPGETVPWEIIVTNPGSASATDVTIIDPIAANSTYVPGSMTWRRNALPFASVTDAADADAGTLAAGPVRVELLVGALLGPGESATLRFEVTVNPGTGGQFLPNQATVTSDEVPPTDSNLVQLPILAGATANLTGHVFYDFDGDGVLDPGEDGIPNISVEVTYNEGSGPVTTTVVTDANGDWALPFAVVPGNQASIDVREDDPDFPTGAVLTTVAQPFLTAVLAAGANASTPAGYDPPDLVISKVSDAGGQVSPGQVVNYTVTIQNLSGVTQNNIDLDDLLPPGTTYGPGASSITLNTPAQTTFRTTNYEITAGQFTATTYNLDLAQALEQNYFVLITGSAGNTASPAQHYVSLTADPFTTGQLVASGTASRLQLTRGASGTDWTGNVTVVECLQNCTTRGFRLLDVRRALHTGTTAGPTAVASPATWDTTKVMLLGGFRGAGCNTADTNTARFPACQVRFYPTGTSTFEWTRDGGGAANREAATSTVQILEWGSEWTVQNVLVTGAAGGNGVNIAGEYNTTAISSRTRANTWVWGTGHTGTNGAGNGGEGLVVTLGDGVSDSSSPVTTVAVGSEYNTSTKNVQVWALSHPDLSVDYRFKADGDNGNTTIDVTVDAATTVDQRFALSYNGKNSTATGAEYRRSLFGVRYNNNTTVRLTRQNAGGSSDFPAWVQGIDLSGLSSAASSTPLGATGAAPALIQPPGLNIDLLADQSLVVTFQVTVDANISEAITQITNTAEVDSVELGTPLQASVTDDVVHLGLVVEYNNAGFAEALFPDPQTLTFAHDIVNTGNADDSYTVIVDSELGWRVELLDPTTGAVLAVDLTGDGTWDLGGPINTGVIAPGERVQYDVRVTIPAGTPLGTQETVRLKATSDLNPAISDFSTDEIEVIDSTDIGPVVLLPDNSGVVTVDGSIAYAHYLVNNTGGNATFNLDAFNVMNGAANPPGWSATIYGDTNFDGVYTPGVDLVITNTANLPDGASQLFFVVVDSPPSALESDTVVTWITGWQTSNPNIADVVNDTTTVVLPASHDLAGGGTRLVQGGDVAIFPGTLYNQGTTSDTFEISVSASSSFGIDAFAHPTELWVDTNSDGDPDTLLASDTDGDGDWDFLLGGVGGINDPDGDGLPEIVVAGGALRAYELRRATSVSQAPYRDLATLTAVSANSSDTDSISAINLLPSLTDAVVSSFDVRRDGGRLVLRWETASEVGTAGFEVFRRTAGATTWSRVANRVVPALLHHPQGGRYRMVDPNPGTGKIEYQLVERLVTGERRLLGTPLAVSLSAVESDNNSLVGQEDFEAAPHTASPDRRAGVERPNKALKAAANAARIVTQGDGLIRLTATDLASAMQRSEDNIQAAIDGHNVALTRQGQPVAWLRDGQDVVFLAKLPSSIYSAEDVVQLRLAPGLPLEPAGGFVFADDFETGDTSRWSGDGSAAGTLRAAVFGEADNFPATAVATDADGDFWHWEVFFAGGDAKSVAVPTPAPAGSGSATLRAYFQGFTATNAPTDHRARITVGGVDVGTLSWDGSAAANGSFSLPAHLVGEGSTNVTITPELPSGVDFAIFYLDRIEIDYNRRAELVNGRLDAHAPTAGAHNIAGLGGNAIALDRSNPDQPRRLGITAGAVEVVPGVDQLLVANLSSAAAPERIEADSDSSLLAPTNRASYLVIAGAGLESVGADLANLRTGSGFEAKVLSIEDVYDEFSFGAVDPIAVQRLLTFAHQNWALAPTHVALLGDGSFDYRDHFEVGENLLLSPMTVTANGLVPSDQRLADIDGDGIADVAIGRIPVRFADQASDYIANLSGREGVGGAWRATALWVADDPDFGGEFPLDLDALADSASTNWTDLEVDRSRLAIGPARAALLDALSDGSAYVTFLGHGGLDRMANEGLLTSSDVASISNGLERPVVAAMTCTVGRSDFPGFETMTEELLLGQNGGAIAVISPTALQLNADGVGIATGYFGRTAGGSTVGSALLQSLRAWVAAGGDPAVARTFALVGDPALPYLPGETP